jgi:hypothetical protein
VQEQAAQRVGRCGAARSGDELVGGALERMDRSEQSTACRRDRDLRRSASIAGARDLGPGGDAAALDRACDGR